MPGLGVLEDVFDVVTVNLESVREAFDGDPPRAHLIPHPLTDRVRRIGIGRC